jgi:hypothetical protein
MTTKPKPPVAIDRRIGDRRVEPAELSPEFLAVLLLCGGEARTTDRDREGDARPRDRRQHQDP